MKISNSKNTKTMSYFVAAFKKWYEASGFNLVEAGAEFELSHTFISQILKRQASISFGTAELIANKIGKDLVEMLLEGRTLVGDKPRYSKKPKFNDHHQNAKEAFDFVLLHGGEAAELIEKTVIDFAKKKQAEADLQNPATATHLLKSA